MSNAWCKSFRFHLQNCYSIPISLTAYIDDFFGGPIRTESLKNDEEKYRLLKKSLIEIGKITNTHMNVEKCLGPARRMDILRVVFDSRKHVFYRLTK